MDEQRMSHRLESLEENRAPNQQLNATNQIDDSASARIDAYVCSVMPSISSNVSTEKLIEIEAEMRLHLESLISAHMELGATCDQAITLALQEFGNPSRIKQSWQVELGRKSNRVNARRAFRWAACVAAATLVVSGDRINYDMWASIFFFEAIGLPFLAGLIAGGVRELPYKNSALALLGLMPWVYLTFALWGGLHFSKPLLTAAVFGSVHIVSWVVSGLAGAAIGSTFRWIFDWAGGREATE